MFMHDCKEWISREQKRQEETTGELQGQSRSVARVGDLSVISNMSRQARNMHASWRIQRSYVGIDEMNLG